MSLGNLKPGMGMAITTAEYKWQLHFAATIIGYAVPNIIYVLYSGKVNRLHAVEAMAKKESREVTLKYEDR